LESGIFAVLPLSSFPLWYDWGLILSYLYSVKMTLLVSKLMFYPLGNDD
jgi:hypothetical protein